MAAERRTVAGHRTAVAAGRMAAAVAGMDGKSSLDGSPA
jgi:hypothetical protein